MTSIRELLKTEEGYQDLRQKIFSRIESTTAEDIDKWARKGI